MRPRPLYSCHSSREFCDVTDPSDTHVCEGPGLGGVFQGPGLGGVRMASTAVPVITGLRALLLTWA